MDWDAIAELFAFGRPIGEVWPRRPDRPLADKDAREHALEQLRKFISLLVFRRTMEPGAPARGFRVPIDQIHVYQPDDAKLIKLPAIGFLPARGHHEEFGLGPPQPIEETQDVYGPGTVLVYQSDYVELFTVEVFAAKHAIRRGVMAGLKDVLRACDSSAAIGLKLPGYYDRVARFWMPDSQYVQEPEIVKNRRRGQLFIELRVPEVRLVDYVTMRPVVDLGGADASEVYDGNVWLDFGETPVDSRIVRPECED
jgi:hypothetical protein